MNNLQPAVEVVCVHDSAATSAWAVARAMASGVKSIVWVARTGFTETNPAGRNDDVITTALQQGWMTIGDISEIEVDADFPSGGAPTVHLTFGQYDAARQQKAQKDAMDRLKDGAKVYELYRKIEADALAKATRFGDVSDETVVAFTDGDGL
jgi:hypothetical protein